MANDHIIKNFTAKDIEKYHKGLLSPKEMHELEKAALDDPFLADALEGYAIPGVNLNADLADLQQRLAGKTEQAKVIPLETGERRRRAFPLFRIAAMFVVLAGAAILASQFLFNNKKDGIAKTEDPAVKAETVKPAGNSNTPSSTTTGNTAGTVTITNSATTAQSPAAPVIAKGKDADQQADHFTKDRLAKTDARYLPGTDKNLPAITTNPAIQALPGTGKGYDAISPQDNTPKKELVPEDGLKRAVTKSETTDNKLEELGNTGNKPKTDNAAALRKRAEPPSYYSKNSEKYAPQANAFNTFRGRVTDRSNAGVPFANVINVQDNAGTYTDANGYFNFTSPDSILNIQVRSVGFEINTTQMRDVAGTNQVVLKDDRNLSEVVISRQKPNVAARSQNANMRLEEPEPVDGWNNYDAYIANNLNVPEDYKTKQTSVASVEVSFEVDRNGEPINITIVKSLCSQCDKEAIRLIKDGPKWKRKARKGRTTVTINF